jgi:hypothetical protein
LEFIIKWAAKVSRLVRPMAVGMRIRF